MNRTRIPMLKRHLRRLLRSKKTLAVVGVLVVVIVGVGVKVRSQWDKNQEAERKERRLLENTLERKFLLSHSCTIDKISKRMTPRFSFMYNIRFINLENPQKYTINYCQTTHSTPSDP